jgi:hypothetical protein
MSDLSKMKNLDLSVNDFAVAIQTSWNKAIESVIQTAQMVKRAEEQLERRQLNELKRFLEQERIMSGPTFSKLSKIAANPVLTAPENLPRLPPSYATLYELSQHDADVVQDALASGKIHAAIKNREILDVLPKRPPKRVVVSSSQNKLKVSIKFTADVGIIPDELLQRLNDVLFEIDEYVDIQSAGLDP